MKQYLECAKITTTHGVRGAVRLENRCDDPYVLAELPCMYYETKDGYTKLTVVHASVQKSMVLATFAEIDTMEAAIALRDTILYADRKDIPLEEGAHFIADIIGLTVLHADSGETLGKITDVISPAGQDIYVIEKPDGGECLVPAVAEFVIEVSPEAGHIRLRPIDGMME